MIGISTVLHRINTMFPVIMCLYALVSCSGDQASDTLAELPDDLRTGTLQVVVRNDSFDPNAGSRMSSRYSIIIDEHQYPVIFTEDVELVGLFNDSLAFLGGKKFLVRGEIDGEHLRVSYLQYLNPRYNAQKVFTYRNALLTPLHKAVLSCQSRKLTAGEIVTSQLNSRGSNAATPIFFAVALNCFDVFQQLLDAGADSDITEMSDSSLLHTVMDHTPDPQLLDAILDLGFDLNAQNASGISALYRAVENADSATVERLLKLGADPNLQTYLVGIQRFTWQHPGERWRRGNC